MNWISKSGAFIFAIVLLLNACAKPQSSESTPQPSTVATLAASGFSHKAFDELLGTYVTKEGWVDYPGLQSQRSKLDQYLATLATANPASFPNDAERLAFWINAYNAFTLADVLTDVYGKHKSVKEIENAFFKTKKHTIANEQLTLDEIEKKGRDLKDPRIHFAVNCASASCPKLQAKVFTGAELDAQLTKVAREFLADSQRGMNYFSDTNVVYLSPIFKWYAADFTNANGVVARIKAESSGADLLEVTKTYLPQEVASFFTEKKPKVDYLTYDWSLNDKAMQTAEQKQPATP